MVHGAPFPGVYNWTWGEIVEYVQCDMERRKGALRDEAQMYFATAALHARMLSAKKDSKFSVMDAYDFLWSDKERAAARAESLKNQLLERAKRGAAMRAAEE